MFATAFGISWENAVFGKSLLLLFLLILLPFVCWWPLRKKNPCYSLRGRHVCITGGSQGIGLALAAECIRQGARFVTIMARDRARLTAALDQLEEVAKSTMKSPSLTGRRQCVFLKGLSVDVTDFTQVEAAFSGVGQFSTGPGDNERLMRAIDARDSPCRCSGSQAADCELDNTGDARAPSCAAPVDVLFTCAGTCVCDSLDRLSESDIESQIRLNILGTLYPARQFLVLRTAAGITENRPAPAAREAYDSVVVLVGSIASQVNLYGFVPYGASKFAIRGIWEALSFECGTRGIRVICAFPPSTDTPGLEMENRRKPRITEIMEGSPGVQQPQVVARQIVRGVQNGKRCITFGFIGRIIATLTNGFAPHNSLWDLVQDIVSLPICRIVAVLMVSHWNRLIRKGTYYTTAVPEDERRTQGSEGT